MLRWSWVTRAGSASSRGRGREKDRVRGHPAQKLGGELEQAKASLVEAAVSFLPRTCSTFWWPLTKLPAGCLQKQAFGVTGHRYHHDDAPWSSHELSAESVKNEDRVAPAKALDAESSQLQLEAEPTCSA